MTRERNWIAVASAEHVRRGRDGGFMQVCHGKSAPLRRVQPNDRVIYYSPTELFRGRDKLQAFTAIGIIDAGEPYQFDMGNGFCPFRRSVAWFDAREAPIAPLLGTLISRRAEVGAPTALRLAHGERSRLRSDLRRDERCGDCYCFMRSALSSPSA